MIYYISASRQTSNSLFPGGRTVDTFSDNRPPGHVPPGKRPLMEQTAQVATASDGNKCLEGRLSYSPAVIFIRGRRPERRQSWGQTSMGDVSPRGKRPAGAVVGEGVMSGDDFPAIECPNASPTS